MDMKRVVLAVAIPICAIIGLWTLGHRAVLAKPQVSPKPSGTNTVVTLFSGIYYAPATNVHDYSVAEIKRYAEFLRKLDKEHSIDGGVEVTIIPIEYSYCHGEKQCSLVYVDSEGNLHLEGISAEDALLLVISDKAHEMYETAQRREAWDKESNLNTSNKSKEKP